MENLELIKDFEVYQNQRWFFVGIYILDNIREEQEETTEHVRGIKWQ
jgi:hypothetical protein|tara:strand:+ start:274 stop:414 length:141 start_codon:yes stop_codon:yes gene_type:complete